MVGINGWGFSILVWCDYDGLDKFAEPTVSFSNISFFHSLFLLRPCHNYDWLYCFIEKRNEEQHSELKPSILLKYKTIARQFYGLQNGGTITPPP